MNKLTLNKEIIQRDFIEVSLSKEQIVTSISNTDVKFDKTNVKIGENLILSNGKIKIGKGIKYVKISYTLWLENPTGYVSHHIAKNGENITYNIDPYLDGITSWHTSTASCIVEVSEGDLIGIVVRFASENSKNKISHYTNSNRFIVEAI